MVDLHQSDGAEAMSAAAKPRPSPLDPARPVPAEAIDVLADLGMSDEAIARYFRLDPGVVRRARRRVAA